MFLLEPFQALVQTLPLLVERIQTQGSRPPYHRWCVWWHWRSLVSPALKQKLVQLVCFFCKNLNKSLLYLSKVWCSLNLLCLFIKSMNALKVVNLKQKKLENLQSCFYGTVSVTPAVAFSLLIWSSLTCSFLFYFYFSHFSHINHILRLLFNPFHFLFYFHFLCT